MFQKILCAVDGSEHAARAAEVASKLAAKHGGAVTFLTVTKEFKINDEIKRFIELENLTGEPQYVLDSHTTKVLQQAKDTARAAGVKKVDSQIKTGPPARTIVGTAERGGFDTIVLGSRGLGDVGSFLLGSVAHKVTSLAKCTVVTVA